MKKLFPVIVMILVVIGLSSVSSNAGVKIIWPDQLKPEISTASFYQSSRWVYASPGTHVYFNVRVKLPLGKVVKKLTLYYVDYSDQGCHVSLNRVSIDGENRILAIANSIPGTGSLDILAAETDTINFGKIKKGFIYYINVMSFNSTSRITGIKITYK